MIYHVLPGDATAADFRATGIEGEVIVCRECLIVGDSDAENLDELWEQRARFILAEYAEDEIEYQEKVADELVQLLNVPPESEVYLWFEYELFCSVNLWFCLWLLSFTEDVSVYRVEPAVRSVNDRWKGFGGLNSDDLRDCFDAASRLEQTDIALGAELWDAYRKRDFDRLEKLAQSASDRFPYLQEVCDAAVKIDTRPLEILNEITASGITDFPEVFAEFTKRAGVYGLGDLQVERLLTKSDI